MFQLGYNGLLQENTCGSENHNSLSKVLVTQSCLTLCDPMNCSLPGSSVRRIHQARIQEWVAISFCRGSS